MGASNANEQKADRHAAFFYEHICTNKKILFAEFQLPDIPLNELCKEFSNPDSHIPPITKAHREEAFPSSKYTKHFEDLSLKIRSLAIEYERKLETLTEERKSENYRRCQKGEPELQGKVLVSIGDERAQIDPSFIRTAIENIAIDSRDNAAQRGGVARGEPLALKIVGGIIEGDVDFSNLNLPISVRLIGCHIQGCLILDRCQLETLDISGSVIEQGISASGMKVSGAFRARKLVSFAPVDLPSIEVAGMVDMTDAILFPRNLPSENTSYVAHRGILNLAYSKLSLGLRLERARIYGGVNMRSCQTGGLLHMDDIVLRCALAHFELMAHVTYKNLLGEKAYKAKIEDVPLSTRASVTAAKDIAEHLHDHQNCHGLKDRDQERINLEYLRGPKAYSTILKDKQSLQYRMLLEHRRGADSAIRLEAATIGGPIHANGARINGRVRMKYISVKGDVNFEGSRIRTPRSIRKSVGQLGELIVQHWASSAIPKGSSSASVYEAILDPNLCLTHPLSDARTEYAIDLMGAKINGKLSFALDQRENAIGKAADEYFLIEIKNFLRKASSGSPDVCPVTGISTSFANTSLSAPVKSALIIGEVRITNADIMGDVLFKFAWMNAFEDAVPTDNKQFAIVMKNCFIKSDVDFQNSKGINSVNAINATIGRSILFVKRPKFKPTEGKYEALQERAIFSRCKDVNSEIRFDGATVERSAFFLFDRINGPDIHFAYGKVAGRLAILPSNGPIDNFSPPDKGAGSHLKPMRWGAIWDLFWAKELSSAVQKHILWSKKWSENVPPIVDLHGTDVPIFIHHPRAWPQQDGLIVSGMNYISTEPIGHLFPAPRLWADVETDLEFNIKKMQTFMQGAVLSMAVCLSFFAFVFWMRHLNALGKLPVFESARNWSSPIGVWNTVFLLSLGALFLIRKYFSGHFRPKHKNTNSHAVEWLDLQRRHFSTLSVYKDVRPSEPFLRAAIVLRTAGRLTSANEVEIARIHQRAKKLSWRKHFFQKILLKCLNFFSDYGFNPTKLVFWSALVVIAGAMKFNYSLRLSYVGDWNSLGCSVDAFVPVFNFGLVDSQNDLCGKSQHSKLITALQLTGWLVLTLIGMSVATRLESIWSRSKLI